MPLSSTTKADKSPEEGVNQAACLAGHKPLHDADYLFSYQVFVIPTMDEFDELLADARRQARRAGLKRSDVTDAVAATRRGR